MFKIFTRSCQQKLSTKEFPKTRMSMVSKWCGFLSCVSIYLFISILLIRLDSGTGLRYLSQSSIVVCIGEAMQLLSRWPPLPLFLRFLWFSRWFFSHSTPSRCLLWPYSISLEETLRWCCVHAPTCSTELLCDRSHRMILDACCRSKLEEFSYLFSNGALFLAACF